MLWKTWTQSQCNQGTDKQTEKKSHRADFLVFADIFFFSLHHDLRTSNVLKGKMLHHAVVLSERHWVTRNIFQSKEEIGCCCTGTVVFWNRASLVWTCRGSGSPTGSLKKKASSSKLHTSVSALQSGALVECCTNLNMGCLVPNCNHFALTRSGDG